MASQSADRHSKSADWTGPKTCPKWHCGSASQHFPKANQCYWSSTPNKKEILKAKLPEFL